MTTIDLLFYSNLFGTVAQLSFGMAAVLLIILTFDDEHRKRWFENNNAFFISIIFLTLVWPGVISLNGLTPNATAAGLAIYGCAFYASVTILWWVITKIKPPTEPSQWKWSQKFQGIKVDALVLTVAWVWVFFAPETYAKTLMGEVIILSIFLPAIAVFVYWKQRS